MGQGRVLMGGSPLRIVRLGDAGARVVRSLFRGDPVGPGRVRAQLARRLVTLGLAHPVPPAGVAGGRPTVTVIIPVKDDADALVRTLDSLQDDSGVIAEVVVVDDGSADPARVRAATAGRARLIRRARTGGPAQARRDGMAAVSSPVVAYVDAGVEVSADDLARLASHLADPAVAAVAPRVRSAAGPGALARYEQAYSPLDLGDRPSPVRPGSRVPYVPTACLVVRADAVAGAGGFDPGLRYGEDVDLVWRLSARGHTIRYEPSIEVTHPPRSTATAWVRQRIGYGRSAGPLARRHGSAVAPAQCSPWSMAVWGLVLSGHPMAAAAVTGWTALTLEEHLRTLPDPGVESVRLTLTGHAWAGRGLARQLVRVWWPLTLASTRWPLGRRLLLVGVAASLEAHRRPVRGSRLGAMALGLADDVAYGTGVWWGLRRGGAAAVAPRLATGRPSATAR